MKKLPLKWTEMSGNGGSNFRIKGGGETRLELAYYNTLFVDSTVAP